MLAVDLRPARALLHACAAQAISPARLIGILRGARGPAPLAHALIHDVRSADCQPI